MGALGHRRCPRNWNHWSWPGTKLILEPGALGVDLGPGAVGALDIGANLEARSIGPQTVRAAMVLGFITVDLVQGFH